MTPFGASWRGSSARRPPAAAEKRLTPKGREEATGKRQRTKQHSRAELYDFFDESDTDEPEEPVYSDDEGPKDPEPEDPEDPEDEEDAVWALEPELVEVVATEIGDVEDASGHDAIPVIATVLRV